MKDGGDTVHAGRLHPRKPVLAGRLFQSVHSSPSARPVAIGRRYDPVMYYPKLNQDVEMIDAIIKTCCQTTTSTSSARST